MESDTEHLREAAVAASGGVKRRRFLAALIAVGAGVIAVLPFFKPLRGRMRGAATAGGKPAVAAKPPEGEGRCFVIAPGSLPHESGDVREMTLTFAVADRWKMREERVKIFIQRLPAQPDAKAPDVYRAFSSVCPHMGCVVSYDKARERFLCPCHKGVFGKDGARASGPAPRGLDELPVRLTDAGLEIEYKRYLPNISDKHEA